MAEVTELWIYPVKGLAGISVTQAVLTATGLKYDRHWMVVDDRGRFVTQRQLPQMATVTTEFSEQHLILRHSSQVEPLRLPLTNTDAATQTSVKVWDSELPASEVEQASDWLTQALASKRPLQLVRFASSEQRLIKAKYLQKHEHSHTQFADGFPVLICNEQTLTQLNQALVEKGEVAVPMTRFRGNIILDECGGSMAELTSLDFSTTEVQLSTRKPCERCPVTKIDQQSGERMHPKEPLTTLTELNPLPGISGAYFGGNAIVLATGTIHVGDNVCVTASGWQPRI